MLSSGLKALRFYVQAGEQGSPRQDIKYGHYPFSEQKQWEAKVKETDTTDTRFYSSL